MPSAAIRRSRTCYDHLAGELGVAITDAMLSRQLLADQPGLPLTEAGLRWLANLGVELPATRRPLTRSCLDWTERRPHLAGAAGAALCSRFLQAGWVRRIDTGRAVQLTAAGTDQLHTALGLCWSP
jgi:hypothetical protein